MRNHIILLLPEFFLLGLAILVLLGGLLGERCKNFVQSFSMASICIFFFVYISNFQHLRGAIFSDSYLITHYTYVLKSLMLGLAAIYFLSFYGYTKTIAKNYNFEYLFLGLISVLGSLIVISSNNFILLYLSIEIISLSSYVMAAYNRDHLQSCEAGIKYFAIGGSFSCIILFGLSFIYGATASLDYQALHSALSETNDILVSVGLFMLLFGLLFKLSVVPFHFWAPDVYDGSPLMSVTFFASINKIPIMCAVIIIIGNLNNSLHMTILPMIKIFACLSLIVGSIGAIIQKSIKRLMAYSTILNIGYPLACLSLGVMLPNEAIIYLAIYSISVIGFFTILYMLLGEEAEYATIYSLQGLAKTKRFGAASLVFIMFSLIGLPPLSGFFVKYIVLLGLFKQEAYLIFVIAIISALIAATYYLKIIKMLYFNKTSKISPRIIISDISLFVASLCFVITFMFAFSPISKLLELRIFV